MGQKNTTAAKEKNKNTEETGKRYATRFGQHYSIIMKPTVTEVINGIPVTKSGKTIEFKNGIYETSDPAEQNFLETSGYLGIDYMEVTKEVDSALKAKSLAEKEQELKDKEDELKKREMDIKGQEEGSDSPTPSDKNKNTEKNKIKEPKF